MRNVYIFGASEAGRVIAESLADDVRLLGFLDNDAGKQGSLFEGVSVLSPNAVRNTDYDFILIGTTFYKQIIAQLTGELGVGSDKIVHAHLLFSHEYLWARMESVSNSAREIQGLCIGNSYTMFAVSEQHVDMDFCNLGIASQDLYYDSVLLDHVLGGREMDNLRYVCLGLARYSFQYDMSKKGDPDLVVSKYINTFEDPHHALSTYALVQKARSFVNPTIFESVYESFKHRAQYIFNRISTAKDFNYFDYYNKRMSPKEVAETEHNKNYQLTVKENLGILDRLLSSLLERGLVPVLFCAPCCREYTSNINRRIEDEFLQCIAELQAKHKVPFWDKLRTPGFTEKHFYDGTHMNGDGARLFSSMLGDYLREGRHA